MAATRPTAVNLFWAIDRMKRSFAAGVEAGESVEQLKDRLDREARADSRRGRRQLPRDGSIRRRGGARPTRRILTHCNAGALATAGYGTALGVIRGAVEAGKHVAVFADETRPFLQGARLTAWELVRDGIDTTVITDNMAGALMRQGKRQLRCRRRRPHRGQRRHREQDRHLLASPCSRASTTFRSTSPRRSRRSTCDTPTARSIPIEERNSREVTHVGGVADRARRRVRSGIRRST